MKVPPEISFMSAVRAHYGGVISCNISGRPSIQRDTPSVAWKEKSRTQQPNTFYFSASPLRSSGVNIKH